MKICIIGINYAPEPTGIAPYTAGLAEGLSRRQHSIRVVTGYPHYPWWKVAEGYTGLGSRELLHGVEVTRVRHYVPRRPASVRRALMEVIFGIRALLSRWGRPDVVLLVSPALLSSRLVQLRARAMGVPVVTWVQDIYTLGLVQTGADPRHERIVRRLEFGLLKKSTRVVVIHERFKSWLSAGMSPEVPVDVVRNWSHVEPLHDIDRDQVRSLHGWGRDDVVVVHAGNMGAKQGLENVVAASQLAAASGASIRFVLLGDGNQREQLESLGGNSCLQFIRPLPDELFNRTLNAADVLLVNELPGLTEMSVPSKLTTYYATGLPVVASVDAGSVTAAEVELAGAGLVVEADQPAALVAAVERLAHDPQLAAELGSSGRRFRETYLSQESAIESFERVLRLAAGVGKSPARLAKKSASR